MLTAETVPEAAPVQPHKQNVISMPPCEQDLMDRDQFWPHPVTLDSWTSQTSIFTSSFPTNTAGRKTEHISDTKLLLH